MTYYAARFDVASDVIAQALKLPDGVRIDGATFDTGARILQLHVSGPERSGLPAVRDGARRWPLVAPTVTRVQETPMDPERYEWTWELVNPAEALEDLA